MKSISVLAQKIIFIISLTVFPVLGFADDAPPAEEVAAAARPVAYGDPCSTESGVDPFSGLSTQLAGDTSLVSAELLKAFAPFTQSRGQWFLPKAIGIRATTSIPVTTSTKSDYGDAAILLRDGGLVGLTLTLMGSPYWYVDGCETAMGDDGWIRPFYPDRTYLAFHPVKPLTRAYITHGLTGRAIKAGLEDDDDDSGSDIAAAGTAYIGLGFDGPIGLFRNGDGSATTAGTIDFQLGYQFTKIGARTLQTLYENPSIEATHIESIFGIFKLTVTESIYIDVEYVSPRGGAAEFMGEVTTFRIGYNFDRDSD